MLLSVLADRFYAHKRLQQRSAATLVHYESDISHFLEWLRRERGRRDLAAFTHDSVEDYQAYLVNLNYAPNSVRRRLSALSEFGKLLVAKGHLSKHPLAQITRPKKARRLPDILEPSQVMALLALPLPSKEAAIRALFCFAGVRRGAIPRLDLRDVKLELGVLILRHGKGDQDLAVPVSPALKEAMESWLLIRGSGSPEDPVFPGPVSSRLQPTRIQAMVKRWGRQIGRPDLHPHLLRHTMLTRLVELTGDVTKAQEMAGHRSIETTMPYIHLVRARLAEDVAAFSYGPKKIIDRD